MSPCEIPQYSRLPNCTVGQIVTWRQRNGADTPSFEHKGVVIATDYGGRHELVDISDGDIPKLPSPFSVGGDFFRRTDESLSPEETVAAAALAMNGYREPSEAFLAQVRTVLENINATSST